MPVSQGNLPKDPAFSNPASYTILSRLYPAERRASKLRVQMGLEATPHEGPAGGSTQAQARGGRGNVQIAPTEYFKVN